MNPKQPTQEPTETNNLTIGDGIEGEAEFEWETHTEGEFD